ncbi:unnamed protein product, partial [Brenthis ino]
MNNIANSTSPVLNSMENRSEVEQYNENEELFRVEETEENTNLYTKKRYRDEDDTEMWTLVSRNSKRKYRRNLSEKSLEEIDDKIEVCITSKEKIPKQIELARFLKEHNILNIIRVKYATPYKIFVLFEEESDAEKMITSTALQEKGWKCYKTSEVGFSYGIIRDIELDLSKKDVQLSISSDLEIISVKRLFRRNDEIPGWTESETIRLCFKGSSLPPHIFIYGLKWNAQSFKPKLSDFELLLNRDKIHIAVISETWLNERDDIRISGYNIYRYDRSDGYGGVAIISHNSVRTEVCQLNIGNSDIELLRVKIHNCNNLESIYALYCPPSARTSQSNWDEIFSIITQRSIILGDFNGHHHSWSNRTDRRGIQIFDSLVDSRYVILNNSSLPTRIKFVNNNLQKSSPDLSLVSSDIALNCEWFVTNESLGSDHLIIKLTLNYSVPPNHFVKKRNFKLGKWEPYRSEINSSLNDLGFPVNAQLGYDMLLDCMNRAADKYIPFIKFILNPSNVFKPKPFWNMIVSKSIAERRLALVVFRDNPTPNNLDILQNKVGEAQRILRQSKSKSWQNFCNGLCEVSSINEMWFRMKWIKGRYSKKSFISSDSARDLLQSLAPDFVVNNCPTFRSSNYYLETSISRKELEVSIKSKDTAPGVDMNSFSMIKNLPESGKKRLAFESF